MKKLKIAVMGIQFTEDYLDVWKMIKEMDFLNHVEVHLVHVSGASDHAMNAALNLPLYPANETRVILEHAVTSQLESLAPHILPPTHTGRVVVKCLFGSHPKKVFSDYVSRVDASMVILAADRDRMFSMGSFIQYQCLHSKAAVLVLREKS